MPWTLHSISSSSSLLDVGNYFGHNFEVEMTLQYTPGPAGQWSEPPPFEWQEKIIMLEHSKQERWEDARDQARYAPLSPTLRVWRDRYLAAFQEGDYVYPGDARVLDNNNQPVHFATLRGEQWDDARKAEAVRDYLKNNGGRLRIRIHDIPALGRPDVNNTIVYRERLLLITAGLQGIANKVRWTQRLMINNALQRTDWTRLCTPNCSLIDLPRPEGYKTVFPIYRPPSMQTSDPRMGQYS